MNPAVANLTLFLVSLIVLRSVAPKWKPWQHFLAAFLVMAIAARFLH
jgi:hypothetical protein